ncbi:MAG TPA: aspartate/glutamate racemase family protein [Thermodesulfobacteriota bacterium]|nr:aspartate/glutamate racemase family protein [Thermodesulfobacteriota bacterium]
MKIWCQLPIAMPKDVYGGYYELLMQDYNLFKDKETDITIKDVPTGIIDPELINYLGFRMVNDTENIRSMLQAESEGYDAIAGACYFDTGIKGARNLLSIPIVGAAEASMHLACIMGNSFAVVTSEPTWIKEMEHHLKELGFGHSAISYKPVRSLTIPFDEFVKCMMSGNFDSVIKNFIEVSKRCLEDDAEVIIAGCGLVSPMLTTKDVREIDGAPIIDPMVVSLKFAELMAKLSKAGISIKSTRGLFTMPSSKNRIKGLKELRLLHQE